MDVYFSEWEVWAIWGEAYCRQKNYLSSQQGQQATLEMENCINSIVEDTEPAGNVSMRWVEISLLRMFLIFHRQQFWCNNYEPDPGAA